MLEPATNISMKEEGDQISNEDQKPKSIDSSQQSIDPFQQSADPSHQSVNPSIQSVDSSLQSADIELKLDKSAEKKRSPIDSTQAPEIILNTYGERVDTDGNRLDAAGNILQIEESNEEEGGRMLMDELKPAQFFKNRSAIVLPPMHGRNFQIEIGTIEMVRDKMYYGLKHEDPFDHIEVFEDSIGNINFDGVSHEWLCCKLFHYTLGDTALRWLKLLEPGSLKTWKEVRSEFLNHFFDEAKSEEMRRKITTFQQTNLETFSDTWRRYKRYLRDIPHHGFSDSQIVNMFFEGVNSRYQRALAVASGGNFKGQNHANALKVIERYAKSSSANEP